MNPIADRSSLTRYLQCPKCQRILGAEATGWTFDGPASGISVCTRAHSVFARNPCSKRWWAMALSAGAVQPQLAAVFSEDLAGQIMTLYQLPASLAQPMWWQLDLSREQYETHGRAGSRHLLRALVSLIRGDNALVSAPAHS